MAPDIRAEEKNYQQKLLVANTAKRKIFGLLERPSFAPSVPQVTYKLFICGRPGSGKTWARSRLVGQEVCSEVGREEAVAGIEASTVYWPMKAGGRLLLFRLELWEAGEWSVRRYDHILPACREGVSGVVLCFSITDQTGWKELPRLLASSAQPPERTTLIPLATRIGDASAGWEVSPAEIQSLEERCGVTVLRMPPPKPCNHGSNAASSSFSTDTLGGAGVPYSTATLGGNTGGDEMQAIAPVLNAICGKLWQRDQELMTTK